MRGVAVLLLCAAGMSGQQLETVVPDGTRVAIRLETTLDTAHAHAGDAVEATLLAPIVAGGVVVVPRNARIMGHTLAVEPRRQGNDSRLLIRFEQAQWRDQTASLNAYIVRQLATREVVRKSASDRTCPSISNFFQGRRGDATQGSQVPAFQPPPCFDKLTRTSPSADDRLVFVSPPLKDMQLEKPVQPPGATAFVSHKKNIELARGTMFELVQVGP